LNRLLKMAPCLLSLLLLLAGGRAACHRHQRHARIATVDWTMAETLLALGVPPMAVGMWPLSRLGR
jgi:iron complex transport system substrate-binding protein